MKTLSLTLFFILAFNITFSQNKKQATVEIYTSTIGNNFPYLIGPPIWGLTLNRSSYHNAGINYIQPLNSWLSIMGGVEFSKYDMKNTEVIPSDPGSGPDIILTDYPNIQLISFPVNIQVNFFKYFLARAGFMVDIETKNNSINSYINTQSGIGLNLEAGAQYNLRKHITLFLSPFFQTHGTILFQSKQDYTYKSNDAGVNLGIAYRF